MIDADVVSLSNLQRQVIHTDAGQGIPKVFSAQAALAALNPRIDLRPYNRNADPRDSPRKLFADYDLILDGTDSFATPCHGQRGPPSRAGRPRDCGRDFRLGGAGDAV